MPACTCRNSIFQQGQLQPLANTERDSAESFSVDRDTEGRCARVHFERPIQCPHAAALQPPISRDTCRAISIPLPLQCQDSHRKPPITKMGLVWRMGSTCLLVFAFVTIMTLYTVWERDDKASRWDEHSTGWKQSSWQSYTRNCTRIGNFINPAYWHQDSRLTMIRDEVLSMCPQRLEETSVWRQKYEGRDRQPDRPVISRLSSVFFDNPGFSHI